MKVMPVATKRALGAPRRRGRAVVVAVVVVVVAVAVVVAAVVAVVGVAAAAGGVDAIKLFLLQHASLSETW